MTARSDVGPAGSDPPTAPIGWRRWAGPLLLVSLMANLLVVGMLAGAFLSNHHHRHGPGGRERALSGFLRTLPPERQKVLLGELEPSRAVIKAARGKAHDARHAAIEAFAADPVDPAALATAFESANAAEASLRSTFSSVLVSMASKLSADERRAFRSWREQHRLQRGKYLH